MRVIMMMRERCLTFWLCETCKEKAVKKRPVTGSSELFSHHQRHSLSLKTRFTIHKTTDLSIYEA